MSDKSISEKIEFFFTRPSYKDNNPVYSPLFLLRKHVRISFGIEPNQPAALWPGSMAILAGIDLLSIYYKGNIEVISENGTDINVFRSKRSSFINFCETFFDLSQEDSEAVYMFRNALMHTFGLVATNTSSNSPNFHKQYWFSASDNQNSECILSLYQKMITINIMKYFFTNYSNNLKLRLTNIRHVLFQIPKKPNYSKVYLT